MAVIATGAALTPPSVREHVLRTVRLALPVMGARAGLLVMTSVDTIMSGRVGGEELAFYAIALAPFIFVMLLGNGLLMGTVVLVAQADGAGRPWRCGRIWRLALLLALLLGVLAALLLGQGERLLLLLGQEPAIASGGGRVLFLLGLGMPPMLLFIATSFFLEGIARPRAGMVVMALANLLNLGLNYVLMFGPFGLPELGAAGAALATTITRAFMFLALVAYALRMAGGERYGVSAPMRGYWRLGGKLLRIGLPLSAAYALESGAFLAMAMVAGWLGALALAAYQIGLSVTALVYMLAIGIAVATAVRVGNAVGRRDRSGMATAGWVGLAVGVAVMLLLMPLIFGLRAPIVAVYTSEPEVAAIAVPALTIVALLLVVDAAQGILIGALRGAGDILVPTAMHAFSFWVVTVPLGYVLGYRLGFGVPGLLWSICLGLAVASLLLLLRFQQVSRRALRPI